MSEKEILLHAAMKHENVVEVKDIVKEIPPTPPGQLANTRPMLIVSNQSGALLASTCARATQPTTWQIIKEIVEGGEMFVEVVDNGGCHR